MLRYKLLLLLLPLVGFGVENNLSLEANLTKKLLKEVKKTFKDGMKDFKVGSYYEALGEFLEVTKYPDSPYFLDSLFMLASTYLYIGKRTGEKRYFWNALNYLNLYLSKGGEDSRKFYYLKGYIYENLGFYEKALASYKLALEKSKTKKEKIKIAIALLRTALMSNKIDEARYYLSILEVEDLTPKQKKELQFLKGLYHFIQKEYQQALNYFRKSYKEFEEYLIENPQYYYLVAETAYRVGDLNFSEYLFRRILNYVKNQEILQKTLLRLGDLQFRKGDYKSAISYYIRLIKTYPSSKNAIVAKLKLLFLIEQDRKVSYFIKKYMPDAPFLKEPQKFVIETLVKNRTNYIGIFALANFGLEAFKLNSPKLYKRLEWELSLLFPNRLEFEHKEYFRRLWGSYLIDAKKAKEVCNLYLANPPFFWEVFEKATLLTIASFLKECKKREYLTLLEKLAQEYPSTLLPLAQAYFELKQYSKAIETLEKVKKRDCNYYKLYSKVCFLAQKKCNSIYKKLVENCKDDELYKVLFSTYLNLQKGKLSWELLEPRIQEIAKEYKQDEVVKKVIQELLQKLLEKGKYQEIIRIVAPLAKKIENDCFLNSLLALSYVRVGKIEFAKTLLENTRSCDKNRWYKLATLALQDALLKEKIKDF